MQPDMAKLEALLGMVVSDLGAAANAALVLVGEKNGLFRALAEGGPQTSAELAKRTGTTERYIREWLSSQAASGYVNYDAASSKFSLTPEQAMVFADQDSTVCMTGGFHSLAAVFADEPALTEAFRSGKGLGWGDRCNCLFCGVERFFRPGYKANLIAEWLPALDGVVDKLKRGARVVDVGCGHGASTMIMAKAFPNSEFVGIDFHDASVAHARRHANGVRNIRFEVGRAQDFAGSGFDLVTMFDALHDMGDPVGAAAHARKVLKSDGTLMLVEPKAGDRLEDNLNPVGRVFYAFSASVCVPCSLNQEVGLALGAQAGNAKLAEVTRQAGFSQFRCAAETPFNVVLEARL
ncbi:class I SAM-dependent methyltransferase [Pseudorhodoplanes sinuspersici]|uniref:SAM-dependent methyltransferase n=1 Tax=Pseudorhodoplanes sinuspersici TaxID=1235591 RepID=A0A1W6ZMU9_9HYPH|nr:class I SAM-dependent methyltransferase [Pseudorhodoplanes sinuspersici]ARP98728.1 SAM-dependent methyltransferase [Pseudorhodoplanes sinuspersici]RKE69667.1 methyltransferase family protein [Pseudorhodoplanes sinuspersici]